jgi:site-specific DNA recombinase
LKDMHDHLMMGGKARLESGKFWASYRLCGYDMVDGKRVINENEAKWVRKIFEWYTNGIPVVEIRKRLITGKAKQKGHSCTKRPWNEDVIRDILRNPTYTGVATVKWDGQINELTYEPIIDKATFQRAQAIMKRNRTWPARNIKIFYLLRGLLRCAYCERGWEVKGLRYKYKNGQRTERKNHPALLQVSLRG